MSINFVIFSKKAGTVSHSVFVIEFIPDFTSPSRIRESGFVLSIISSISLVISVTVLFFPRNTLFYDRVFSKPKCKSVITRLFLSPSIINAGYPGIILV